MRRAAFFTAFYVGALVLAWVSPSLAGDNKKDSNDAIAERMVDACFDRAASAGFPPFSIAVIDPTGALVVFKRQEGASAATAEVAMLKARTSLKANAPTAILTQVAGADEPTRDALLLLGLTTLPGGAPFADGKSGFSGAIGASGGDAAQDVQCLEEALSVLGK
ncbi:MAG: heme-binding protein [Parvularculaceae bacterium]